MAKRTSRTGESADYDGSKPLRSARYERFAVKLAQGMPTPKAWEAAGGTPRSEHSGGSSSRIAARRDVKARVEWLKRDYAEKAAQSAITVDGQLAKLETAYELAVEACNSKAAAEIAMMQAKLAGIYTEGRKLESNTNTNVVIVPATIPSAADWAAGARQVEEARRPPVLTVVPTKTEAS